LDKKIEQLQLFPCSGDNDTVTETLKLVLASYKAQSAAKLQDFLNEPARKKAVDALPVADQKALASVRDAQLAQLKTVCPVAGAVAASIADKSSPQPPPSIPVPVAALPLANKILGIT